MNRVELQAVLEKKFKQQFAGNNNEDISTIARSLAHSIYLDNKLSDIRQDTLEEIIDLPPRTLEFVALMKKLRLNKEAIENKRPKLSIADQETLDWGFFLKCWFRFKIKQDITDIDRMTLMFTARWLLKEKKFIDEDEIRWCDDLAHKHADGITNKDENTVEYNRVRDEAVVFIVMRKFLVKSWTNPQEMESFINEKSKRYKEFSIRLYGSEPNYERVFYHRRDSRPSPVATIKPISQEMYIRK